MTTPARCRACAVALAAAVSGMGSVAAAQPVERGWKASFPRAWPRQDLRSVGSYKEGPVVVNFESLSPLLIEPPPSAAWNVVASGARRGHVGFRDTKPGLVPNPDTAAATFYKRADGAITAMAWVDQVFSDARVTVRVNTGPPATGSNSRQGPMLRWDKGSNWTWCAVNFAAGTVSIVRSQHFGIMKDIEGSEKRITGFSRRLAYDVTFSAVGPQLSCQVSSGTRVVADTGPIRDPAPLVKGVSGVLFELAIQKPFVPLEGSFDRLAAGDLAQ